MNVFESLISEINARAAYIQHEGDYQNPESGLLYCGTCNEPKQTVKEIPFLHKTIVANLPCRCEREKDNQEQAALQEYDRQQRQKELDKGIKSEAFKGFTFEKDDRRNIEITKLCCDYVRHFAEMEQISGGLLFYGDVGGGKSFYAGCIANALIKRGIPVLFTSLRELVDNRQAAKYKGAELTELQAYRCFVLDDIGAEKLNRQDLDTAFSVIDDIYLLQRPLIVTTNLTVAQIEKPDTQETARLYSRIRERCPKQVFVDSKGHNRIQAAKVKRQQMDMILQL
jgi:DNA replication protein DnaC